MLEFVLAACAVLGTSFGGETLNDLTASYKHEKALRDYRTWRYRNPNGGIKSGPVIPNPAMEWQVPNHILLGAPMGPGFPPMQAFPSFPGRHGPWGH